MKLVIYKKNELYKDFIYKYLPSLILNIFNGSYDLKRLKLIDDEFSIDSMSIIRFSLKNLKVSEQPNSFTIEIDKNKRYKKENVESLINLVTYGNRSCKGYPIVHDIFKFIADHIDQIYEEWLDGN